MTDPRQQLIAAALAMQASGLNRGTAGNISLRADDGFYITPTGMPYAALTAADIPHMTLAGTISGQRKPSSEWRLHRDLYAARPHVGAVVHAHSPFAVSLACQRCDIPLSLHDCPLRRRHGALQPLRDFWLAGTVRRRA